jgi:inorganic phosphate transporter, PiT family
MGDTTLLVIVVATALAFDFTNGFHDTANAMATSIATRALRPRVAVGLSAVLNAVGAFLSLKVATTIAKGIVDNSQISLKILFAALVGAIAWNLLTWFLGLPSSSSHALIGGIVGATLAAAGSDAVQWKGIAQKVIAPAVAAPLVAGLVALVSTYLAYRLTEHVHEEGRRRGFRAGQVISASLVSLAHGTNDAQKTMGVITLALVANGNLTGDYDVPLWVILTAAASIGLGTYIGGWRVIRTLGHRVTSIEPPQGFAAEVSGATVILASSFHGYPLSTTHVVSGAVMGSGAGRRLASVHWGIAGQMATAWVLTLPAAGAAAWVVSKLVVDNGTVVTVIVAVLALLAAGALFLAAQRNPVTASNVNEDHDGAAVTPAPAERHREEVMA